VVAVGTYIFDSNRWHSANALYGQEAVQVGEMSDGGVVTRVVRRPDGYFGVPGKRQHHNVSGVLLINQPCPTTSTGQRSRSGGTLTHFIR
jgi:hypothetical protein